MDLGLDEVKKHKIDIIIILALFLIGFGIRLIPSEAFPGIYGFDPYNHARVVRYILEHGYAVDKDPFAYWPEGRGFYSFTPAFHAYTSAGWYVIYSIITRGVPYFDQQTFNTFYSLVGPIYGALAIISLFLIGLAARDKKAGLMAGLAFIATASTLYRTMFGFSEEDPLGFMIYGLSLAVFIYAMRKGSLKWGWMAGLAFGIFGISWSPAVIPLTMIAVYAAIDMILDIKDKQINELERKTKVLLSMIIPMFTLLVFNNSISNTYRGLLPVVGQLLIFGVAAFGILLTYVFKYRKMKTHQDSVKKLYKYAVFIIVILGLIMVVVEFDKLIGAINWMVTKAPYQRSKLLRTVGEEHPAGFAGVMSALGYFGPFFLLGLVWLPIRYFKERKKYSTDLLIWLLSAVTFYLYINKAKMGYVFDIPAMVLVGITLADILKVPQWFISKSKELKVESVRWMYALGIIVILVLGFWNISKGIVMMEQYKPSYSPQSGWIAGLDHFANMADKDKYVFLVWWDYGDWIAWRYMKVTLDGTNSNSTKVMMTARVLSDFRGNSTDEIIKKHIKELKYWGVTHIGIDRILITCQKWGAVTYLGDNVCIPKEELNKWHVPYSPILADPGQGCPPGTIYAGCMQGVYCRQGYDQNGNPEIICPLGKSQLVFTPQQWQQMVSTKWPGYNLELDTGKGIFRARVYARPDGYLMFFVDRYGRILTDAPANYMLGYRLFFQDQNITVADFAGDFWGNLVQRYHYPSEYRYVPEEEVVFYKLDWNKLNKLSETTRD